MLILLIVNRTAHFNASALLIASLTNYVYEGKEERDKATILQ